jgi:Sensors of blue-light using FAD
LHKENRVWTLTAADKHPVRNRDLATIEAGILLPSPVNWSILRDKDMNSDLYRIVYCSRNKIPGTGEEVADALLSLLESARSKNQRLNLTGALLYQAGVFAQVLEGPQHSVEQVFGLIQLDKRNSEVTVAFRGPETERDFPKWSMAFADGEKAAAVGEDTSRTALAQVAINAVFACEAGAGGKLLAVLKTLCAPR